MLSPSSSSSLGTRCHRAFLCDRESHSSRSSSSSGFRPNPHWPSWSSGGERCSRMPAGGQQFAEMAAEEQPPPTPQVAPVQPEVPPMVRQQTPVAVATPEDRTVLLKRFLHLWPLTFSGDHDPDRAESWVHELEHTFETMDCAELLRHVPHVAASEQARTERFISELCSELRWATAGHLCDILGTAVVRATAMERECQFQPQQSGGSVRSSP
ncbi:hypothetical protein Taro_003739 [Colocasia esculenta]|uniref:Uncharacterized protein n=1 Tax=Colocasia esculenta TaxID=4460 RepID=A0A843TKI7_COLES|nr:hypothetical protein [Colocasia esculenta]